MDRCRPRRENKRFCLNTSWLCLSLSFPPCPPPSTWCARCDWICSKALHVLEASITGSESSGTCRQSERKVENDGPRHTRLVGFLHACQVCVYVSLHTPAETCGVVGVSRSWWRCMWEPMASKGENFSCKKERGRRGGFGRVDPVGRH